MRQVLDDIIEVEDELKEELKMDKATCSCVACILAILCYLLFWDKK
jgi:hypothetical protein